VAVLSLAALATATYLAMDRKPLEERRGPNESNGNDNVALEKSSALGDTAEPVSGGSAHVDTVAAELREMSQTYRHSTFLIAIRGSGFYCDDVVAAHESVNGVWLATCVDKLGYTLSVRDVDQFDVRPVAHYFDSLAPAEVPRNLQPRFDRELPADPLERERFRR